MMPPNEEAGRRANDAPASKAEQQTHISEGAFPRQAQRHCLPTRRASSVVTFEHGGQRFRASGSYYADGALAEVFLDTGKAGSSVQQHADDAAILCSLALQHGVPLETVRHSVAGPIARALDLLEGGQ